MDILIAGFQHETNTFAESQTDWAAFNKGATFLAATRGDSLRAKLNGVNLPAAGFLVAAQAAGHTCHLGFWAGATPSGLITRDAFERICDEIVADVHAHRNVDAIYLDLHGAAVSQGVDDCEGNLIARVRAVVGNDMPIIASLDLHANVSDRMLQQLDACVSYRRYPHTDMALTGELAWQMMRRRVKHGSREPMAFGRLPHLIPLASQTTWQNPAKGIYEQLAANDVDLGTVSNFCPGFPASDIAECAPTFWAYGTRAALAVAAIEASLQPAKQWQLHTMSPAQAVREATARASASNKAVVIADVQDNPGAGGDSCTTGLLHALINARAGERFAGAVALGLLHDPESALAAHAAGIGAVVELHLGRSVRGFDGKPTEASVHGRFTVTALSNGATTLTGPMMTRADVSLGPCAALEIDGIRIAVASERKQMLDRGLFQFLGIEPATCKIIVVKSSNHYRADFTPLVADPAHDIINAKSHAAFACDPSDLPWTQLPSDLRTSP